MATKVKAKHSNGAKSSASAKKYKMYINGEFVESHRRTYFAVVDPSTEQVIAEGDGPVADLGCGPGRITAHLHDLGLDAFGIDLSPGMIEQARATGLYAELEVADMVAGLAAKPDDSADLIMAGDAMVYVSDLAPMLAQARRVVVPDGLVAFTLETHDGDGVVLGAGLRYAHAAGHVRDVVQAAGLLLAHLEAASPRTEDNVPVPGLVVVATKP